MTHCPADLALDQHPWLTEPSLGRIFDAISEVGGEARVVGGAVRDALLGRTVGDIDLAVNIEPEHVTAALSRNGIKVVPTGIDHGTITAVSNHKAFEITSLRKDVETDGRHATVAFTDDWRTDAARRDFTINALYVDEAGHIHDYFGGRADLASGEVRFIGKAADRIHEDVLRILRFFRFTASFSHNYLDADGLNACVALGHLLPQLSVERVWRELIKLLAVQDPSFVWSAMLEGQLVHQILSEATRIEGLKTLLSLERHHNLTPQPLLRLASLLAPTKAVAETVTKKFKISNREADKLWLFLSLPGELRSRLGHSDLRRFLYDFGQANVHDALILLATERDAPMIDDALKVTHAFEPRQFPFQGSDILKLGILPGPAIGTTLRAVEEWWIEHDFTPSHNECIAQARKLLKI